MKAALAEPEIVTKKGKPVSVILPIKQYREMIERLEDADDVACLKRARRKKLHYRPLEEVLADLARARMYQVVVERVAEKDLKRLSVETDHALQLSSKLSRKVRGHPAAANSLARSTTGEFASVITASSTRSPM